MDRRGSTTRPVALYSPSVTATTTITIESSVPSSSSSQQEQQPEVLFLPLNRKKKKVSWKDGTVDNEFMQKRVPRSVVSFIKRSHLMKMIVMKMMYHTTQMNIPMITVTMDFVASITTKLAQAVRVLICSES